MRPRIESAMLTYKQEKFVQEYVVCLNAAEAARRAGYSRSTARQMGYENLTKPYIRAAVDRERAAAAERAGLDRDWLIAQLIDNYEKSRAAHKFRPAIGSLNLIARIMGLLPSGRGR